MSQNQLERYSFLWSQARMAIAAIALFIGGTPPILKLVKFMPWTAGLFGSTLRLAWVISGIAAAYLLYLWIKNEKKLFGAEDKKDLIAFFVMNISGINLGIVGVLGINIGTTLVSGNLLFTISGLIYLVSAYYLYQRWNSYGQKLF